MLKTWTVIFSRDGQQPEAKNRGPNVLWRTIIDKSLYIGQTNEIQKIARVSRAGRATCKKKTEVG